VRKIKNDKVEKPKFLLWLAPVLLLISMFSWIRPDVEFSPTVNLIFRVLGIVGAILLLPLIFHQLKFSFVWITAGLGIMSIGLAAYIYSGLGEITLSIKLVIAACQLIWMFFLWRWNRTDKIKQQERCMKKAVMQELIGVVGKWIMQLNKWMRFMTGLLFLVTMTCFCWVLLSFKDFQSSDILIILNIPMIFLSSLLLFACFALLLSSVTYAFSNRVLVRKDIARIVIPSFVFGSFVCWIIPHPIASVVFKYQAFWTLSIIAILAWLGICLLWGFLVLRIIKKSEGLHYYQRIQERLDEYKKEF